MLTFILILFSFEEKSDVNYWKALKGITKISYKGDAVLEGIISKNPWSDFESRDNKKEDVKLLNAEELLLENDFVFRTRNEKRKRTCKFPKSARKLNGKIIVLNGWITHLPNTAYSLTEQKFDPDNWVEWPASDERVELDGKFSKYLGKDVLLKGRLKLNKQDDSRAFYILEDIEIAFVLQE